MVDWEEEERLRLGDEEGFIGQFGRRGWVYGLDWDAEERFIWQVGRR